MNKKIIFSYTKIYLGEIMNRLKELRENHDLLQKELAESLGISQRNYSYFETGQTMLTEDILIKLADYYNTNIDYLLYRTDIKKPLKKSIISDKD